MAWEKVETFSVTLTSDLADEVRRRACRDADRRKTLASVIRDGLRKGFGMDGMDSDGVKTVEARKKALKPL